MDKGQEALKFEPEHGYLRSLLRTLNVQESSQVLVFSKTSLQRGRISPRTPRAIYFNDDVMVGFCVRGRVIEISAVDGAIGTAFYTLDQVDETKPALRRQTESCLLCHGSLSNQGVPEHLIRSFFVDRQGNPLVTGGSFRIDHATPLAERWGGWYVTGTSGKQMHRGNMISERSSRPGAIDNSGGVNLLDLQDRLSISAYPTRHSDIVALMVLEHQVGMLNRLARAAMETRWALNDDNKRNKESDRPAKELSAGARSRIQGAGEAVVQYMLFGGETLLTDRIAGTSSFASDFAKRGPRDSKGRSLRDFDLKTRLFRYPCSYLIYSRAFDELPEEARSYIYRRLWETLVGQTAGKDAPRLTPSDRLAIIEILRETKPALPDYWKAPSGISR